MSMSCRMNLHAHLFPRRLVTATYKLALEPDGAGYDLVLQGHEIRLDEGIPLDASTLVQVAGPQLALSAERRLRLKSSIALPLRLLRAPARR